MTCVLVMRPVKRWLRRFEMNSLETADRFPNALFRNGRRILQGFGHGAYDAIERRELWHYLKGDFSVGTHGPIPDYEGLSDRQRQAADQYLDLLAVTSGLLQRCEDLHLQLLEGGINPELVEEYTLARDEYEDAVEKFGALRAGVDRLL